MLTKKARPNLRRCYGLCFIAMTLLLTCGTAAAGETAKSKTTNPADFVGSETCATCHADQANGFGKNPHSKLDAGHGTGQACESCHGPGKAHVESGGDATKIFRFTKATAAETDAKCLDCHRGQHANFERSAHAEGKVSCTGCHSVHKGEDVQHMLKISQPKLCYSCHTGIKPQFSQPFHHKVEEGLLSCSDCHDPHGTFEKKNLKTASQHDAICTKCHTETAGPFVFEHPPVKTEGCTSCHFPHGGPNPRLLTRSNVNSLCLQCHTTSAMNNAPGIPSFHNQAVQYQACTNCHTMVHGSNTSSVFFK